MKKISASPRIISIALIVAVLFVGGCASTKQPALDRVLDEIPTTPPTTRPQASCAVENDGNSGKDAPNTLAEAMPINADTEYSSNCINTAPDRTFDKDKYKISVPGGSIINLTAVPSGDTFGLTLYDESGEPIGTYGQPFNFVYIFSSDKDTHVIYIEVQGRGGTAYKMQYSLKMQNDANSGRDAGDSFQKAVPTVSGRKYDKLIVGDNDKKDFYSFTVKPGQKYHVRLAPAAPDGDVAFFLWDDKGNYYAVSEKREGLEETATGQIGTLLDAPQSYNLYMNVPTTWRTLLQEWNFKGEYSLEITVSDQNDANSGKDAGDYFGKAINIGKGTYTGSLGDSYLAGNNLADSEDYYIINGPANVRVLPDYPLNVELYAYDDKNAIVTGCDKPYRWCQSTDGGDGGKEELDFQYSGLVYLKIKTFHVVAAPPRNYTLTIG